MIKRLRSLDSQLLLFIVGTVFYGVSMGLSETSFNNFLSDTYQMGADERGRLEFPRGNARFPRGCNGWRPVPLF